MCNICDKHKLYKAFYDKNLIAIEQYKSLRNNFNKLTITVLGSNYYNMAMDVYDSDKCVCEDIIKKLHKPTWITRLLITLKIRK